MRARRRHWQAVGAGVLAVVAVLFLVTGLFLVTVIVPPQAGGGGPARPGQLQVNLVSAPMTVPVADGVHFTWVTSDPVAGETQRGYQVRVAANPAGLASAGTAVWDSGPVTSGNPDADYAGRTLDAGTRYWWTVRTVDAQGRSSGWAPPAQFGTALGPSWDATAVWAHAPAHGTSSGWAFLRGQLEIPAKPVAAATVYASGGTTDATRQYVFRLSLNGAVIGTGPPRAPDAATQNMYSAWDVTRQLRAGLDVFGALAYTAEHPSFQLELVVQFTDGKRLTWGTGPTWKSLDGGAAYPAAGSISPSYYSAPVENLDAEKYPFGFDTPGYTPARSAGWIPAATRPVLPGLTPDTAATTSYAVHRPAKITPLGPGRSLLDFGTTQVGGLRLTLDGKAGEKVTIASGEVLAGPDTVQDKLATGDTYRDTWTLRAGRQTLQYWGYRVFRYVEVSGTPQPLTAANTAALALVYPGHPDQSALDTSSAALDQVWQFSKDTVEDLGLDLYLDSPTRERSGDYEGDDYVHQLAQAAVDGDSGLAQYSLRYVLGRLASGEVNGPIIEYEELAPVAALAQYQQTGDPAVLRSVYGQLKTLLPARYLGADGLVTMPVNPVGGARPVPGEPQQLVDWPASERDGFVFTKTNTVVNAFAYAAYHAMAVIAGIVDDSGAARDDAAAAARIQTALRTRLFDPATGAFRDGLGTRHEAVQSSVYAVALGVASPAQATAAAAWIARQGMACSAYCAGFLLEALYDGGQAQAALNLLTADNATSWRHMIAQGAGSTMEAWTPALKPNLTYSHPWSASPAYVVPDCLFGLSALEPGWQRVLIRPQTASLARGSVQRPTPRGPVSVQFTREHGRYALQVDLPVTAAGVVALPGVRPGQRVWVDGAARTAAAGPPGTAVAGLGVVPVTSGWHAVATAS